MTVADWPTVMIGGVALMLAVGGDGLYTVIVVFCDAGVPAAPVHVKL